MSTDFSREPEAGKKKRCPNPACQFDRHDPEANFCLLCGTLLYERCENCLEINPMYAKYCYLCGTDLEELRLEGLGSEPAEQDATAPESAPEELEQEQGQEQEEEETGDLS